jgi:uncharacterized protein (DUF433 family)
MSGEAAGWAAAPPDIAASLVGVSRRQLEYWRATGLVIPGIVRQVSSYREVRLYEFDELVQLRAVAALRAEGISLQHIRRVVEYLRSHYAAPLREVRFAVVGEEIYFQHADGTWEGDRARGQLVLSHVLDVDLIRSDLRERLAGERRRADEAGRVEKRRKVVGSQPVFAGTRITVATVQAYLDRDYSTEEIIEAYPDLTPDDIETARRLAG